MPVYIPYKCGKVFTEGWMNGEFSKIEAAHNTHSAEDFPAKSVPALRWKTRTSRPEISIRRQLFIQGQKPKLITG